MKFRFRLETVMRQKKIERDVAQKDHSDAAAAVRAQVAKIQRLYETVDNARARAEEIHATGGNCLADLNALDTFVVGQKIRIEQERRKARELMAVEEEKHEILVEKTQAHKVLEKLREKKKEEFRIQAKKKLTKQVDDMVTMRFDVEGER